MFEKTKDALRYVINNYNDLIEEYKIVLQNHLAELDSIIYYATYDKECAVEEVMYMLSEKYDDIHNVDNIRTKLEECHMFFDNIKDKMYDNEYYPNNETFKEYAIKAFYECFDVIVKSDNVENIIEK